MYSVREVAALLGIAEGTLRNRLEARAGRKTWVSATALRATPPMRKLGHNWKVWGPTLHNWLKVQGFKDISA